MRRNHLTWLPFVIVVVMCGNGWARADETNIDISSDNADSSPLRLEELIAKAGRLELDLSLSLLARSNDGIVSAFEPLSIADGQVVSVPTSIDRRQVETDVGLFAGALRFGIAENTEFSMRLVLVGSDSRVVENATQVDSDNAFTLNQLSIGFSYQFSKDDETPALIGFADVALAEALDPDGKKYAHGKTLNVGVRSYRVLDPVVLTMTAGYRFSGERSMDNGSIDPGDILYVNPGIAFVVNDAVTLTGGVNLSREFADTLDGIDFGVSRTRAEQEFGIGFGISSNSTIRVAARSDAVGDSGFTGLVSLQYNFPTGG